MREENQNVSITPCNCHSLKRAKNVNDSIIENKAMKAYKYIYLIPSNSTINLIIQLLCIKSETYIQIYRIDNIIISRILLDHTLNWN